MKTKDRILAEIIKCNGCTSVDLIAADLRLKTTTVNRYVARLLEHGDIEIGWDGRSLCISDRLANERREESDFQSHLRNLLRK